MIKEAKSSYYNRKIKECDGDQRKLFKIIDNLLQRNKGSKLPTHDKVTDLVEDFSKFFVTKIQLIRENLTMMKNKTESLSCPPVSQLLPSSKVDLCDFSPTDEHEVIELLKSASKSSCLHDPIPTKLLLAMRTDSLATIMTRIVNTSLQAGEMPSLLKSALINPLIKKPTLDKDILKNYRPVSNLPFLSKVLEKVVSNQLIKHIQENDLDDKFQSAYKKFHSTETALVRVHNDILRALDEHAGIFLTLLDLSAAFDTVDHNLLLLFLENTIGVKGNALKWIKSYLGGRYQCVSIDGFLSEPVQMMCGVPQGAVLGAYKFCIYTLPIGAIIRHHNINYSIYADDTQLYISFDFKDPKQSLDRLTACVRDIRSWMVENNLKINDDKTEFLVITSRHQNHRAPNVNLTVGNDVIKAAEGARNLGVYFDRCLTMENHITNVARSLNYQLREIRLIRHVLTDRAAEQLMHSLITSRLDYCNSLLSGLPATHLDKLQRCQNTAARIVACLPKREHITPSLKALHWLPVDSRITFKILLLTYRTLHHLAPKYLQELLCLKIPCHDTRSSSKQQLVIPRTNLKTIGDRAFSAVAPKLWNKLPKEIQNAPSITSFKSLLKTHLFKKAYKKLT